MKLIAESRHFAFVGVVCAIAAALIGFGWACLEVIRLGGKLVRGESAGMAVGLVKVIDAILLGAGLLVFALGLFELFVGRIDLPAWLVIKDFDALKSRLAGIVVLVMAVGFLERLETGDDPRDLLYSGIAVSLVSATLIALGHLHRR